MKTVKSLYVTGFAILSMSFWGCEKTESGPLLDNEFFSTVSLVTAGGSYSSPTSAVPDATSQFVYFTASDSANSGVFKVPAGGGPAVAVFLGAPFSKPMDLALSSDNQTIYVADPSAAGGGGIFALSINGGTPILVPGTAATAPVALDVIRRGASDQIYFCGADPGDGQKVVYEIPAGGAGMPAFRHKGTPLVAPAGIVSAGDGTLYIADGGGMVHKLVATGALSRVAEGIIMGTPAGIALTPDDQIAAVSSKSPFNGSAQVQLIDLKTGGLSVFNKIIGANAAPGGLHGARTITGPIPIYGWADVSRPGRVYRLEP